MKSANSYLVVLVTTPTNAVARKLASAALRQKLIACANIIPRVQSMYWWEGKIESSNELLVVMKTKKSLLTALEALIHKLHPYDTPEFLALPLTAGSRRYLDWIQKETR